jgi:DNA-binding NarL/FixJ family response regulator
MTTTTHAPSHSAGRWDREAALYARAMSSLPAAVAVIDRRGYVLTANDAWSTHPDAALAAGENVLEAYRLAAEAGSDHAKDAFVGIASVLSGTLPRFSTEYPCPGRDGGRWFLMAAAPLAGGEGAVMTHTDITALKDAQDAATRAERRARALLEDLPDQIFRMTPEGEIVESVPVRPSAIGLPLPVEGASGRNARDVLPGPAAEALIAAARAAVRSRRMTFCHFSLQSDDEAHRYEVRLAPSHGGDTVAIVRDLTAEDWLDLSGASRGAISSTADAGAARQGSYGLTFREFTVLELMARGAADKEIASQLGVSVFTVNKHVSHILRKMGASSRTEASTRTLREGLVS